MKGLGAVFVVLVMALAGIGAGYATFQDKVTVHGIAESTHLKVGIRAIGTNDDSKNSDGVRNYWNNHDPYYLGDGVTPSKFDVAYTNVWNEGPTWKFKIGGTSFYGKMHVNSCKIYENYAPTVKFSVGVEGDSVPAKISGFVFEFEEKNLTTGYTVAKGNITGIGYDGKPAYEWANGEPTENTIIYNPKTGWPNLDIVSYKIVYPGHRRISRENPDANITNLLQDLGSITIAPGTWVNITITARFTDVPPDHYLDGTLTVNYVESHS